MRSDDDKDSWRADAVVDPNPWKLDAAVQSAEERGAVGDFAALVKLCMDPEADVGFYAVSEGDSVFQFCEEDVRRLVKDRDAADHALAEVHAAIELARQPLTESTRRLGDSVRDLVRQRNDALGLLRKLGDAARCGSLADVCGLLGVGAVPAGAEARVAPGSPEHVELWAAIDDYARACDGRVYGNVPRMQAVARVESALAALDSRAENARMREAAAERNEVVAEIGRFHGVLLRRTGSTQGESVDRIMERWLDLLESEQRHHEEHHETEAALVAAVRRARANMSDATDAAAILDRALDAFVSPPLSGPRASQRDSAVVAAALRAIGTWHVCSDWYARSDWLKDAHRYRQDREMREAMEALSVAVRSWPAGGPKPKRETWAQTRARIEAIVGPLDAPEPPVAFEKLPSELLAALEAKDAEESE